MLPTEISFSFTLSWLLSIFVLSGWIPRPTSSVLALMSHNISRNFPSDVENRSTSSANLRLVRQSSVLSLSLMPFLFSCYFTRLFSSEYCSTVLNRRDDSGSPCLVPLLIGNTSLSLSVKTVPSTSIVVWILNPVGDLKSQDVVLAVDIDHGHPP